MNGLNDRVAFATARCIYAVYEYFSGRSVELADEDVERRVARLISYTEKRLENDSSRLEGLQKGQQWNDQLTAELAALNRKKEVFKDIRSRSSLGIVLDNLEAYLDPRQAEFLLWKEFFSAEDRFVAVLFGLSKYKSKGGTALLRIVCIAAIWNIFWFLFNVSSIGVYFIELPIFIYFSGRYYLKFMRIFTES